MFSIFGAGKSQVKIYVPNRQSYKIVCTVLKLLIQLWILQIVLSYMYIKVSSVYIIMLILNHLPPPIVKYSWAGYLCVQALRYGPFQKQIARQAYLQRLFIVWCLTHLRDTMSCRRGLLFNLCALTQLLNSMPCSRHYDAHITRERCLYGTETLILN